MPAKAVINNAGLGQALSGKALQPQRRVAIKSVRQVSINSNWGFGC